MPLWLFIMLLVLAFVAYIVLFIYFGSGTDQVLDRVGFDTADRDWISFTVGLLWPIGMPVFTVWYISKHVPSLHF
jgi:hypothetical protein